MNAVNTSTWSRFPEIPWEMRRRYCGTCGHSQAGHVLMRSETLKVGGCHLAVYAAGTHWPCSCERFVPL